MAYNAGDVEAKLTLDRDPFVRGLKLARAEAEKFEKKQFKATLDADHKKVSTAVTAAQRRLQQFAAKSYTAKLKVDSVGVLPAITKAKKAADSFAKTYNAKLKISVDTAELKKFTEAAKGVGDKSATIKLNTTEAYQDLMKLNAVINRVARDRVIKLTVEQTGGIAALNRIVALEAAMRRLDGRSATVNINSRQAVTNLNQLDGAQRRAGNGANYHRRRIVLLTAAIAGIAAPLTGAVVGAFMLLPGLAAIAGASFAVVKLGMDGITNAAKVMQPAVENLKKSLSATFEKQLTPSFRAIAAMLPQIQGGLNGVAVGLSSVFAGFTRAVTSAEGIARINSILAKTKDFFMVLTPAVETFTRTFLKVADVGATAMIGLATEINIFARNWEQMIDKVTRTGELQSAFQGLNLVIGGLLYVFQKLVEVGIKMMGALGPDLNRALRALGDALVQLEPFLTSVAKLFIELLIPALRVAGPLFEVLGRVIQPIADAFGKLPAPLQEAVAGFVLFALVGPKVVGAAFGMIGALGRLGTALGLLATGQFGRAFAAMVPAAAAAGRGAGAAAVGGMAASGGAAGAAGRGLGAAGGAGVVAGFLSKFLRVAGGIGLLVVGFQIADELSGGRLSAEVGNWVDDVKNKIVGIGDPSVTAPAKSNIMSMYDTVTAWGNRSSDAIFRAMGKQQKYTDDGYRQIAGIARMQMATMPVNIQQQMSHSQQAFDAGMQAMKDSAGKSPQEVVANVQRALAGLPPAVRGITEDANRGFMATIGRMPPVSKEMADAVVNNYKMGLTPFPPAVEALGQQGKDRFIRALEQMGPEARFAAAGVPTAVNQALGKMPGDVGYIGSSSANALERSLRPMPNTAGSMGTSSANALERALNPALPKAADGPTRATVDIVNQNLGDMAQGLDLNTKAGADAFNARLAALPPDARARLGETTDVFNTETPKWSDISQRAGASSANAAERGMATMPGRTAGIASSSTAALERGLAPMPGAGGAAGSNTFNALVGPLNQIPSAAALAANSGTTAFQLGITPMPTFAGQAATNAAGQFNTGMSLIPDSARGAGIRGAEAFSAAAALIPPAAGAIGQQTSMSFGAGISPIPAQASQAGQGAFTGITSPMGQLPSFAGQTAVNTNGQFANGMSLLPGTARGQGQATVGAFGNPMGQIPGLAGAAGGNAERSFAGGVAGMPGAGQRAGQGAKDGVINPVNQIPGPAGAAGAAAGQSFGSRCVAALQSALGAISGIISRIKAMFASVPSVSSLSRGPTVAPGPRGMKIGGIVPQLAAGGMVDEPVQQLAVGKRIGSGFTTSRPRAIVGEGNPSFPEFVIPTDPQYRKRATGLYNQLGTELGMTSGSMESGMASGTRPLGNKSSDVTAYSKALTELKSKFRELLPTIQQAVRTNSSVGSSISQYLNPALSALDTALMKNSDTQYQAAATSTRIQSAASAQMVGTTLSANQQMASTTKTGQRTMATAQDQGVKQQVSINRGGVMAVGGQYQNLNLAASSAAGGIVRSVNSINAAVGAMGRGGGGGGVRVVNGIRDDDSFASNSALDPNRGKPGYAQYEDGSWGRKYDIGGVVPQGYSTVYNGTGGNENMAVFTKEQWKTLGDMTKADYAGAASRIQGLNAKDLENIVQSVKEQKPGSTAPIVISPQLPNGSSVSDIIREILFYVRHYTALRRTKK